MKTYRSPLADIGIPAAASLFLIAGLGTALDSQDRSRAPGLPASAIMLAFGLFLIAAPETG